MKILFIGHYGGRNIGDEIILFSQMQLFEKFYERKLTFVIYTYDEQFTQYTYSSHGFNVEVIKAFGLRNMRSSLLSQYKNIKNIDFAIIGGGGLIQDVYFSYGIFRYLLPAVIANNRNIPVYTFSLGVYRFNYKINTSIFKQFIGFSKGISVRDIVSMNNCVEISNDLNNTIFQIPDSALLFDKKQLEVYVEDALVFNYTIILREFFIPYLDNIVENSNTYFNSIGLNEVVINIIVFENDEIERNLANQLKNKFAKFPIYSSIIIHNKIDPIGYLNQLNKSNLVLSGRLHGVIPSFILNKNVICLSYSPKIESFCNEHNYKFIKLDELKSIVNFSDFINKGENNIDLQMDLLQTNNFINHIEKTRVKKTVEDSENKKVNFILFLMKGIALLFIHIFNKILGVKKSKE